MKTKHTPGPWAVGARHDIFVTKPGGNPVYVTLSPDGDLAAKWAHPDGSTPDETERANAERIVACVNACGGIADPSVVKEMLEVLKQISSGTRQSSYTDRLLASLTIAKVEGRAK